MLSLEIYIEYNILVQGIDGTARKPATTTTSTSTILDNNFWEFKKSV